MDDPVEYGKLEVPVYSRISDEADLACIPVDDGCLRLVIENVQGRDETTLRGELVDASCRANDTPLAIVETAHVSAYYGHGSLFVLGDVNFDDGSSIELDVAAQRVEWVDGAHCD